MSLAERHRLSVLSYAVVTTVRDDAEHLLRLAKCVRDQAQQPRSWIIVDDGSTDGTLAVAEQLSKQEPWIRVVRRAGARLPTRGARIAEAFEFGLEQLAEAVDVVVHADADVSMAPDFFRHLLHEFARDTRLGIASGIRFEQVRGTWRRRRLTAANVEAQCRAYRTSCLETLLPLDKHRGWDSVDVLSAQLGGWNTVVVSDLPFRHHRAIGARDGSRLRAWMGEGMAAYALGYRPLYLLLRTLFRAVREPAAAGLLLGFAFAIFRRPPRASPAIRAHLRREQAARKLFLRAREATGWRTQQSEPEPTTDLMLVAEPGGHLIELCALRPAWAKHRRVWVTLDGPDSRSLLEGETVVFARGPTCRSLVNLLRNFRIAWRAVSAHRPRVILATGSGVVVPLVWVGRLRRVRTVYIECGGRVDRPSLSCRLVAPVAELLYVQWPELQAAVRSARYAGMIRWDASRRGAEATPIPGLVFATVGTSRLYPFDRLVRSLSEAARTRRVVIQHGIASERPSGAELVDFLPFHELDSWIAAAETVVTHGGIGSVLLAFSHGKRPIVMPRRSSLGECVDDHQLAFTQRLAQAGLVTTVDSEDDLAAAVAAPSQPTAATALAENLTDEIDSVIQELLSPVKPSTEDAVRDAPPDRLGMRRADEPNSAAETA